MLIEKSIQPYIVFVEDTILSALNKINANKSRIVFAVNEGGLLMGSLSDGDFRRWITSQPSVDLDRRVSEAMNSLYHSRAIDSNPADIQADFNDKVAIVPLVDKNRRIVAIAKNSDTGIVIGNKYINEESPCFVIAEIGNNHNGSLELAKRLVDLGIAAGADCCKFQMRQMEDLYGSAGLRHQASSDLGAEYTMDLLKRFQLSNDELFEIFDYTRAKGCIPMCTPWDRRSLSLLEDYGMEAYKVASADLTNHDLLDAIASTNKPMICSTGMSTEAEIRDAVNFLRARAAQFVLLHCNSTYPAPFKDVNLNYLDRLRKIGGAIIGYSGHERGYSVPVAAVARGAKVIEKHFTVDRSLEGNDHKVSLLPEEMSAMIKAIREVEDSLGRADSRTLTQGEMMNREVLAKSLHVNRALRQGDIIERDAIEIRSPGQGLQPCYLDQVVGQRARRDFAVGDILFDSDIRDERAIARKYKFRRPMGIPARFHDYAELARKSNMDFVEFHLSYRDMQLRIEDFFNEPQAMGFAVHSPELFAGDHILDLCSLDEEYRQRSVNELQRVVAITRELKQWFPKTERPVIVVNAGGHSKSGMLPAQERHQLYELVAESLSQVDQQGIELIMQTMPPFPWHFGGQSFHNLFMSHHEIEAFHKNFGYRSCLDISHSKLACNYFKWDFHDFVRIVGPVTAHLHIADGDGVDGEGVQIGTGDVDFHQLAEDLDAVAPHIQFIPEIWQGHKNGGEGFWHALDMLERYL